MTDSDLREAVGPHFSMPAMLHARARSTEAVVRIAAAIRPGMTEGEAVSQATGILRDMGMQRIWHPTLVRSGAGTLKKFNECSDGSSVLGDRDIFFVDIGPVWDGHEGGAGWRLNLDIKGHRVSDFPHAIYKAGNLGDFADCPNTGLWILEIQIAHPTRDFGAFHEDILASDLAGRHAP